MAGERPGDGGVGFSWFAVELDTTAPVVTFGVPTGLSAGQTITVPYEVSEPALVTARLTLANGQTVDAQVSPTAITYELPSDAPGGLYQLRVRAVDEVANATDELVNFIVEGVAGIQPSGGERPSFTHSPLLPNEVEFEFACELVVDVEQVEVEILAEAVAIRPLEVSFSASVSASRNVAFEFSAQRDPAHRWSRLLREDEEICLALVD